MSLSVWWSASRVNVSGRPDEVHALLTELGVQRIVVGDFNGVTGARRSITGKSNAAIGTAALVGVGL